MFWRKKTAGQPGGTSIPGLADAKGGSEQLSVPSLLSVFIVSDDAMTRVLHCSALRESGCIVETAAFSGETMARIQRFAPSVLLVDLDVRNGQGFTVVHTCRNQIETREAFIIALSADSSERIERKAAKSGADLVLNKAATKPAELVERIKRGKSDKGMKAAASPAAALENPTQILTKARRDLQALVRSTPGEGRTETLRRFAERISSLAASAANAGDAILAHEAVSLSKVLGKLADSQRNWPSAVNRTLAQALDLLNLLTGQRSAAGGPAVESTQRSTVVITPDRQLASTLQAELAEFGFSVRTFEHADEALVSIRQQAADLVAVDVNLEGMSSLMICAAIREMPGRYQTPFLFVAAPNDLVARSHMMLLGRVDIVVHPTQPVEVILKALTLVLQSRAERKASTNSEESIPICNAKPAALQSAENVNPEPDGTVIETPAVPDVGNVPTAATLAAVVEVDASWTLISINDAGRLLLDCVDQRIEGRRLHDWFPTGLPDSPQSCLQSAPAGAGGGTAATHATLQTAGQSPLPVVMQASPARQAGRDSWQVEIRPHRTAAPSEPRVEADLSPPPTTADAAKEHHLERLLTITLSDRTSNTERFQKAPEPAPDSSATDSATDDPPVPSAVTIHPQENSPEILESALPATIETPIAQALAGVETTSVPNASALPSPIPVAAAESDFTNADAVSETSIEAQPESGSEAPSTSEDPDFRRLRARAANLERANAALKDRLDRSIEATARSTAEAQREQAERRRATQQVAALTSRLSRLHDELHDHLSTASASQVLHEKLGNQCRKQAEDLTDRQTQLDQLLAEKKGLEERLRASQSVVEALQRQVVEVEDSHRRTASGWDELDQRLKKLAHDNADLLARLRHENEERRRLDETVQQLQTHAEEIVRRSTFETSRLRSELHAELSQRSRTQSRLENVLLEVTDAEQSRCDELRRIDSRLRPPSAGLMAALGQLLESDLSDDHRKILETATANLSLIQSHLDDLAGLSVWHDSFHQNAAAAADRTARSSLNGSLLLSSPETRPSTTEAKQF